MQRYIASRTTVVVPQVDLRHNGVAILTRDVLVIDVDKLKDKEIESNRISKTEDDEIEDGLALLDGLISKHGLPNGTPKALTPSGGKHLFFSISKSLEQGLRSAQNRTKITVNVSDKKKKASLDVRGIGGCILVAPSSYTIDGKAKHYEFEVGLCRRDDLPAAPSWLIDLLNEDTKRQGQGAVSAAARTRTIVSGPMTESDLFDAVKPVLELGLKNKVDKVWKRAYGFDFSVVNQTLPCAGCDNIHESNNYQCRELSRPCVTVNNWSSRCTEKLIGLSESPVIKHLLESPKGDDPYVHMLRLASD